MTKLDQLSPSVTLFRIPGSTHFALRIYDPKDNAMAVSISKSLPPDATSLLVITPTDMRMFAVSSNGASPPVTEEEVGQQAATEEDETIITPVESTDPEVVGETPQGTKVVRRKRRGPESQPNSPCGRCMGTGQINMIMDGGQPAKTACGVCSGTGKIVRWGEKR